jgi:hypothetical protein
MLFRLALAFLAFEVDFEGRVFAHWRLGNLPSDTFAYTDNHGLYKLAQLPQPKQVYDFFWPV